MTALNKQALRQLATRATPGPWEEENGEVWIMRNGTANSILTSICGDDTSGQQDFDNARFIAAANPAAVLTLLDELEAAQKLATQQGNIAVALLDEVTMLRRNANDNAPELRECLEAAERRIAELEAREVTLPEALNSYAGVKIYRPNDVIEAIRAAGIGVKGE
ncbi:MULTISPECIES: ead/Ea22-like family protein [Citrobacter]|uniref:ead/Ea22-like family protein n=1 Tax=Citrobacter TaxID=544 RepID=UPI001D0A1C25|nr:MULTISPECIES: ead/Ea22-like family protein [Citrobacter]MBX8970806.1 ead/Ea22-like family protein [Citrobacter werkmanii]MBX9017944.1 ead/Ea22-like family protein [Citrobacter werkmanii]MDM3304451.1 ead/Ea22-like family protein [Citrobacter sp. Cc067]